MPGIRRALSTLGATVFGVVVAAGFLGTLARPSADSPVLVLLAVTAIGVVVGLFGGLFRGRSRLMVLALVFALGTTVGLLLGFSAPSVGLLAVLALAFELVIPWLARARPAPTDALVRTRKGLVLWLVLALFTIFQTVRFGAFMVDSDLTWGSAFPLEPSSVHHMCLPAYLYAAELASRGASTVYSQETYRGYLPQGSGATTVDGMGPWIEDPFLYPPPFLLLPRLALAASLDYLSLRTAWYLAQALALLAFLLWMSRWIGGREGATLGLLWPLLWVSIPTMFNLQYGQFQLAAVVLGIFAMISFARARPTGGGLALAFATVAKVFPGILLIELLVRRRYRAVASTLAWIVVLTGLAFFVFGSSPFVEYLRGMLGQVASGEATRFAEEDFPTVLNNLSIYGIVVKLRWLGVLGMSSSLASALSWVYTLVPIGFAVWFGLRAPDSRWGQAQCWVALLNLATLRSPNAPGAYALFGTLLLLLLLTPFVVDGDRIRGWRVAGLVVSWLLFLGTPPLPTRELVLVGSMVTQILVVSFNVATLVFWIRRSDRAGTVAAPASGDSR